jgi:hypothetical protein
MEPSIEIEYGARLLQHERRLTEPFSSQQSQRRLDRGKPITALGRKDGRLQ